MAITKKAPAKATQGRGEAIAVIAEIERVNRRIESAEARKKALEERLAKLQD